jgi:transcriptional regulator with XRE-family HTH domain
MDTVYQKQIWLTRRREELRLSQEDLATQLQLHGIDITRPTISHWENGRHLIPLNDPQMRAALARSLNLSIRELLIRAGYEIDDDPIDMLTKATESLLHTLTPEQRAAVASIVQSFARQNTLKRDEW